MMHPPAVVIVLLSCAILNLPGSRFTVVTGLWVGHPESPFADRMALFEHVLLNDDQWSPVLNQVIKLSSLTMPRYHLPESYIEVLNRVQLVDPKDTKDHTVMFVIQQLMKKTPWSGTNANFTAYALSTGVTCFMYKNLSFVLDRFVNRISFLAKKIAKIEGKKPSNEDGNFSDEVSNMVDNALYAVHMMLLVLMDKVAAVEGELIFFSLMLYDYDTADETNDKFILLKVFKMILEDVNKMLKKHCGDTEDKTIYEYLGKYESLNDSPTPPDKLEINKETLTCEVDEFKKIINSMIEVYHGLDVETMPMETWIQILDYKLPVSLEIKLFIKGLLTDPKNKNYDKPRSSRYIDAFNKIEGKKTKKVLREIKDSFKKIKNFMDL